MNQPGRLFRLAALCAAGLMPLASNASETLTLAFVGDVMLADGPGRLIARGVDPLRHVAPLLKQADVRIANLECVIADNGRAIPGKPWVFRAHPRTLTIVRRHFDVVGLANNHSGDYGPKAFAQMLDRLQAAQFPYVGGGRNLREAHAPWIIERKGLRIALLAYNEFFPRRFEAGDETPGIAWSEDEQVRHDIEQARRVHHADLVIPFMHWGWENETVAGPRQRALARLMIDAGADAVVGGHPHVVQDTETYRGKPIIYSLGNFVFDGFDKPENNLGWMLFLEAGREGIRRWQVKPVRIDAAGSPRPLPHDPGMCWQAGQPEAHSCPAAPPSTS